MKDNDMDDISNTAYQLNGSELKKVFELDWENPPELAELKQDYESALSNHQTQVTKIDAWLALMEGKLNKKPIKGRSQVQPKLIRKQAEWRYAALSEPFLSTDKMFEANPVTWEDKSAAEQAQLLLNHQFNNKLDKVKFIDEYIRTAVDEGTVILKVGWEYKDEIIEIEQPIIKQVPVQDPMQYQQMVQQGIPPVEEVVTGYEIVEETKVLENKPTVEICAYSNITIDPTCLGDLDKANFIIYSYESSLKDLEADGRYKNLDQINVQNSTPLSEPDYYPKEQRDFEFKDKPRKKFVVHEYWGYWDIYDEGTVEPILATYVGDTLIRLELNPFPDGKLPFVAVQYLPVRRSVYGEPDAELLEDNQNIVGAVTRGMIDLMGRSANAQQAIRKDALDVANQRKFEEGKDYFINANIHPEQAVHMHKYPEIPNSAMNMISLMNSEAESISGVKSFSSGISGQALGNMLDIDTDVPLIDGSFRKLADIVNGDKLIGSDGRETTVLQAHGIKLPKVAYEMSFDNSSVIKSGGEHLWTVKVHGTSHKLREWTTLTADKVYKHMQKGRRVTIPKMQEVHSGKPTGNSIDPYVLGFWLGDGNSHSARITTADPEILDFFGKAGYTCVEVKDSSKTGEAKMYDVYKTGCKPAVDKTTGQFVSNGSLHSELKELGLHSRYGGTKHIPEEYFTATYEEKMELIRGLMDSDGFAHSGAFVQFAQSEGRLKDDMIKLLESLGLKTSIRVKKADEENQTKLTRSELTGSKMIWARKDSYEIGFTPWSNPFKLSRKADNWQKPKIKTVTLKSMVTVDKVYMRCLTVDSADKLFAVTDKYTLTHNTATGIRSALDATSKRELGILRRLSNGLTEVARKFLSMSAVFLSDQEVVRITNDEFVEVKKDDLAGAIDISLSISTAETDNEKAQELAFMLQTLGNSVPSDVTMMILADIAKLRKMPELAKNLKEYQPQPDPLEQERKQLELEMLKAEIADRYARAQENQVDALVKQEKAGVENAKARQLNSKADLDDLNFLDKQSGKDVERDIAKQTNASKARIDEKAADALLKYQQDQLTPPNA